MRPTSAEVHGRRPDASRARIRATVSTTTRPATSSGRPATSRSTSRAPHDEIAADATSATRPGWAASSRADGDPVAHRERRHAQRQGQFLLRRLMHARARPRRGEDHLVGTRGYDQRRRCTGRHPRRARLPRCGHDHLAGARPSGRMPRSRPPWRGFTRMRLRAGTWGRRLGERGRQPGAGGQPQQPTNVIAQGDVPPVRPRPVRPLVEPPRPAGAARNARRARPGRPRRGPPRRHSARRGDTEPHARPAPRDAARRRRGAAAIPAGEW